mmetsp:Transcript_107310/g.272366  ORF Transcript_107310/g.272366 Transcript_107310/m.272366 type:complete len:205 (+) Transcript_107310:359-973(+)
MYRFRCDSGASCGCFIACRLLVYIAAAVCAQAPQTSSSRAPRYKIRPASRLNSSFSNSCRGTLLQSVFSSSRLEPRVTFSTVRPIRLSSASRTMAVPRVLFTLCLKSSTSPPSSSSSSPCPSVWYLRRLQKRSELGRARTTASRHGTWRRCRPTNCFSRRRTDRRPSRLVITSMAGRRAARGGARRRERRQSTERGGGPELEKA